MFMRHLATAVRAACALAVLTVSLMALSLAHATSFAEVPFPTEVQDAPIIVRGSILFFYAASTTEKGSRRIYTYTELNVSEVIKGQLPRGSVQSSVMMRELGGEKDGMGLQVYGTAKFARGEDVVVFLGPLNPDGSHEVRGMMMGKYNLEHGSDGKEYLKGPGLSISARSARQQWSLDDLRALVRQQGAPPSLQNAENGAMGKASTHGAKSSTLKELSSSEKPAPRLQPAIIKRRPAFSLRWILGIAAAFTVLGFLFKRRR